MGEIVPYFAFAFCVAVACLALLQVKLSKSDKKGKFA